MKLRKLVGSALAAAALLLAGCAEPFDDSLIRKDISDLQTRMSRLEQLCSEMNTNISSLQTIVTALQSGDYITNVTPITKDGVEVGYTISFAKSGSITIYHGHDGENGQDGADGKDGRDGSDGQDGKDGENGKDGADCLPVIGIRQDSDGCWYWTIDGEWLLDDNGNKVKASGTDGKDGRNGEDGQDGQDGKDGSDGKDGLNGRDGNNGSDGTDGKDGLDGKDGTDGKDGVTPLLKINDGFWYVSYDDGATWSLLGVATGAAGSAGDSMFKSVSVGDTAVTFVLADGTTFSIPLQPVLKLVFESTDIEYSGSDRTVTVPFTISGGDASAVVECVPYNDWDATVSGSSIVATPGKTADGKVLVLLNCNGRSDMKTLKFTRNEPGPGDVVDATIAQVIAEQNDRVTYRLTGTVAGFNKSYCSFDLQDETGSIYVYSVTDVTREKYAEKLSNGDKVTVEGTYLYYADKKKHELVNATITFWQSDCDQDDGDDDEGEGDGDGDMLQLSVSSSGFPTAYGENNTVTVDGYTFVLSNVADYGSGIQFKKNVSYIANTTAFGRIKSIKLTSNPDKGWTDNSLTLYAGTEEMPSATVAASDGKGLTFDLSGLNCTYFMLANEYKGAVYLKTIEIEYE